MNRNPRHSTEPAKVALGPRPATQNVTIWYHYLIFPFARLKIFHLFPHDIRRSFRQIPGYVLRKMLPYGITF